MTDEHAQDLAALHALGLLEGEEAAEFERREAAEPELARLAAELRETTAALALATPRVLPPDRLKIVLLARVAEPLRPQFRVPAWVPWAAAALLLVSCGGLLLERERLRGELFRLHSTDETARSEREGLRGELTRLRATDALAQVELRALRAAGGQSLRAVAVVAWDPVTQRGLFEVQQLPAPAAGKDYQLWVIDPARADPVSAGVFLVDANGRAALRFHPVAANLQPTNFAVSLEPAGGSPQTTGPILLVGQ